MLVILLKIVENGYNGSENVRRTSVSVSRTMKNERTIEGLTAFRPLRQFIKFLQSACHEIIALGTGSVGIGSTNLLEIVIF